MQGHTKQAAKKQAGFTLIELIVVITIIAVLSTIGFLNLPRDRPQVNEAARNMMADLNRARTEAIRLNTSVAFEINYDSSSYRVFADPNRDSQPDAKVGNLTLKVPLYQMNFSSDFPRADLSGNGRYTFWFNSRGLPSSPGRFIIQSASGDYRRQVDLASQGRIEVN